MKCGLLYEPKKYFSLTDEEQSFVEMFIDALKAHDAKAVNSYCSMEYFSAAHTQELYEIALEKVDSKIFKADKKIFPVRKCYPSIELSQFCKNSSYKGIVEKIPLGFGIFWEIIVPKIIEISKMIGSKYLYLFAADNTKILDEFEEKRKLLLYYQNSLKFAQLEDMIVIQPDYDRFCIPLVQEIASLYEKRESIWDEFEDIID